MKAEEAASLLSSHSRNRWRMWRESIDRRIGIGIAHLQGSSRRCREIVSMRAQALLLIWLLLLLQLQQQLRSKELLSLIRKRLQWDLMLRTKSQATRDQKVATCKELSAARTSRHQHFTKGKIQLDWAHIGLNQHKTNRTFLRWRHYISRKHLQIIEHWKVHTARQECHQRRRKQASNQETIITMIKLTSQLLFQAIIIWQEILYIMKVSRVWRMILGNKSKTTNLMIMNKNMHKKPAVNISGISHRNINLVTVLNVL